MQMKFPVYVHGMLKTESFTGVVRPGEEAGTVTVNVPAERRINDSLLEVRFSPTLAGAMVDAPAVPRRLPVRMHRADPQPLPADGHHAEHPEADEARSQGDPSQADEPERPGDRRRARSGRRTAAGD